ncbi:hypothetical protein [Flavobacterium sp. N502540]|uniref:hypothetical protein n=1 Tax=Flavobacterium sp. N502540 TaxID=2986838 RepID=UPI0022257193|nr:hypothetical protein [Flavobacterium sp. N502540]
MDQALYSEVTLKYLIQNHVEFLENIDFEEDKSFGCSIKSMSGNRFLWIATYDLEITIGFENSEKECDWHFHIGSSGGNNQYEELKELSKELNKILSNEQVFILEHDKYIPFDKNERSAVKENKKFFVWNEI